MKTNESHGVRRIREGATKVLGAFLMVAGTVLVTAPALGAVDAGCGDYSYDFTGTRLINDGISTSAGPFAISLPAGTYDITLMSDDNHPYPTYQTDQTQEQWYFELDNGYVSPPTNDVPNDSEEMVTTFSEVELDAATTITVKHLLQGTSPNSVNVSCIGFTASDVSVLPPATTTTEAPAIAAPTTVDTPDVEAVTTTTGVAVAPASTIATEVKGVVETPVQQLAVTGRDTNIALFTGVLLIMVGMAFVTVASRPETR